MTVWVVRHAKAGSRRAWSGEDARRPLSKPGRRQADALGELLASASFDRIVSSPFVRCRETVEPLAASAKLEVALDERLAEGAGPYGALSLVREAAPIGGVLCSHGDVIPELLARLERSGIDLGDDPRCEKGSVWALELDGQHVVSARYLPPPASVAR
ncbi:MAG: SixA phosphatase family protein [Acidimicrobiia bacterium]